MVTIRTTLRELNLLWTRLLIVNHFGKNPRKGGKPPRERKFIINRNFVVLVWFINLNICLMKKILNTRRVRTILMVMIE